jgi:hypothetical protein
MMRTIWLALTLLIGVGALTAIKVSVATPVKQPLAFSSTGQIEADFHDPSLAKGDKLQVSYAEPPSKKPVQSIPIVPSGVAASNVIHQKIITRHWHEGDPIPAKRDTHLVRSEAKPKK